MTFFAKYRRRWVFRRAQRRLALRRRQKEETIATLHDVDYLMTHLAWPLLEDLFELEDAFDWHTWIHHTPVEAWDGTARLCPACVSLETLQSEAMQRYWDVAHL
jgi:hypothetical protein